MTNPAVEALKREHTELVAILAKFEGQFDVWGWHRQTKPDCDACRVIAQAEQTPVAGRVVSEELWAYLVEYCEASQPLVALCTKSGETPRLLKNLEALRAAPTVRKEEM